MEKIYLTGDEWNEIKALCGKNASIGEFLASVRVDEFWCGRESDIVQNLGDIASTTAGKAEGILDRAEERAMKEMKNEDG